MSVSISRNTRLGQTHEPLRAIESVKTVTRFSATDLFDRIDRRKACSHIDMQPLAAEPLITGSPSEYREAKKHLLNVTPDGSIKRDAPTSADVTMKVVGSNWYGAFAHYLDTCKAVGETLPHPVFNPEDYRTARVDPSTNLYTPHGYADICPKCGYHDKIDRQGVNHGCMCTVNRPKVDTGFRFKR